MLTKADADALPRMESPRLGMTLQMFLPIGHRKELNVRKLLLNGKEMPLSKDHGYELRRGSDGWHVFVNLPPEVTKKEKLFCIIVSYEIKK